MFAPDIAAHGELLLTLLRVGVAAIAFGAALKVIGISIALLAANPVVAGFIALGVAVAYPG